LQTSNNQNTTGCSQILDYSVKEPVHLISIAPRIILPLATNSDRDMNGSKNCPRSLLQVAIVCIMERKNKFIKLNENIT